MKLYKYRSLQRLDYVLDIILNERLFCPFYKNLNDPFEGIYATLVPSFGVSEGFPFFPSNINKNISNYSDIDYLRHDEFDSIRICSLSSTFSDIKMLSNYADGHKGVIIEIEISDNNMKNIEKVKYNQNLPQYGPTFAASPGIRSVLSNKTFHWDYEKEYRVIGHDEYFGISNNITAVYCGIRTPEKSINILRKAVPENIPIFTTNLNKQILEVEKGDFYCL